MLPKKLWNTRSDVLSERPSPECEFSLKKDSDETLDFVFHISPLQTQSVHTFSCPNSHFILMKNYTNSKHQLSIIFCKFTAFFYSRLPSVFTGRTLGYSLNPHSVQSTIAPFYLNTRAKYFNTLTSIFQFYINFPK